MRLKQLLAAIVALATSLLLAIISFYWAVSEGGAAVAVFSMFAAVVIVLIALGPWGDGEEG
ncbi:MAG: hypothetical protein N3H31_05535 [Candidatus Nezhaarchaeota archaeon]|nr:hypothetical protein [Candidatus Nezhaarchaeota archaeon]